MKLTDLTNYYCPIGLNGEFLLTKSNDVISTYDYLENGDIREIQVNFEEEWMTVKYFTSSTLEWDSISLNELIQHDILDLDEMGNRWEGSSLNGNPFGYGCIYNTENQLSYKGFIYDGKKVCYGTCFYEDTGDIQYEGSFYQDFYHGLGTLYNKKRELIYDGEWHYNNPLELKQLTINTTIDIKNMNMGVEEVKFCFVNREGDQEYSKIKSFQLIGYSHLKRITIENGCGFENVREFIIENCNVLETVSIGYHCFHSSSEQGLFAIRDCERLKTVAIDDLSFEKMCLRVEFKNLSQLESITIGKRVFYSILRLSLTNLPLLKSLQIGISSFHYVESFTLADLPSLSSFKASKDSFAKTHTVRIINLPQLRKFTAESSSFKSVTDFTLSNLPVLSEVCLSDYTFESCLTILFESIFDIFFVMI